MSWGLIGTPKRPPAGKLHFVRHDRSLCGRSTAAGFSRAIEPEKRHGCETCVRLRQRELDAPATWSFSSTTPLRRGIVDKRVEQKFVEDRIVHGLRICVLERPDNPRQSAALDRTINRLRFSLAIDGREFIHCPLWVLRGGPYDTFHSLPHAILLKAGQRLAFKVWSTHTIHPLRKYTLVVSMGGRAGPIGGLAISPPSAPRGTEP